MFGIDIGGPADVFCDNHSVMENVTLPQLVLNKRHNVIFYHRVRETQDMYFIIVVWIQGEYKQAELRNKTTLSTNIRYKLVNEIMCNDGFMILN